MEQKILHPWNRFPQTNQHFANYGPSLLPNQWSLVTSTCSGLAAGLLPPKETKLTLLTVVCGSGVAVSQICLFKLTLSICMFPFGEGCSALAKACPCQPDHTLAK